VLGSSNPRVTFQELLPICRSKAGLGANGVQVLRACVAQDDTRGARLEAGFNASVSQSRRRVHDRGDQLAEAVDAGVRADAIEGLGADLHGE
jgi:hypothetical protein